MNVKLVGLSQDLSFESGDLQNFVVIELPTGKRIRANIESSAAQTLTELFVQKNGVPPEPTHRQTNGHVVPQVNIEPPPKQGQFSPVELAEFGGDYDDGENESPAASLPPMPPLPTPNWAPAPRLATPRSVQADSAGNPVAQGEGLVDPVALVGGDLSGEEDAGQI